MTFKIFTKDDETLTIFLSVIDVMVFYDLNLKEKTKCVDLKAESS